MEMGDATVVAATISTVGILLAGLLQRFRNENRKDHAEVISELRWLRKIIERVESKHDQHIEQFHEGDNGGKPRKRSRSAKQADAPR